MRPGAIELQRGWQGGPASISVEVDEVMLDGDVIGCGVLISVETTLAIEGSTADLGVLSVDLPDAKADARLTVCASIEQARALRDALSGVIAGDGVA